MIINLTIRFVVRILLIQFKCDQFIRMDPFELICRMQYIWTRRIQFNPEVVVTLGNTFTLPVIFYWNWKVEVLNYLDRQVHSSRISLGYASVVFYSYDYIRNGYSWNDVFHNQVRFLLMNGQNIDMAFLKNMGILGMTYTLCFITIKMVNSYQTIALTLLYKDIESKLLFIFLYVFLILI